jgi:hypothetical protein
LRHYVIDEAGGFGVQLPQQRGSVSSRLFDVLAGKPRSFDVEMSLGRLPAYEDDDLQIALFVCYAMHYRGFEEVDSAWEWHPSLIALRGELESRFETDLHELAAAPDVIDSDGLGSYLLNLGAPTTGPSLSMYMRQQATLAQFREYLAQRSLYNVIEADPHTFVLPRLWGKVKATMLEIQFDEYGGGNLHRMHSTLFCEAMEALDLDATYGAYVDLVPAVWIANLNIISMFALHRRLRGALLGQLAMFEIGSSIVTGRASDGLTRLGLGSQARRFFDEHVQADAVHEQLAAHGLCGAFAREFPEERSSVVFGALSSSKLTAIADERTLQAWNAGSTALRKAL